MKRRSGLVLSLGLLLLACGGDDSSNGGGGSSGVTLISSTPAPADATCPDGGVKIQVGVDKNGNGTLDPDEITGAQEICTGGAPATLTTVTPNGPDATCKNGGITVKSGPDTNGNGKLDASEVTQTQEICDGGSSAILSTTTTLADGNSTCPLGGVETQSGPDNGAGGAVAGDGVLAPSEITSATYACISVPGYFVGSFAPPPAVMGATATKIDLHGGAGSTANGGGGGAMQVSKLGTLGGHIKVFTTGVADASFTMPAYTPTFGATKLDVTTDTTLMVHTASSQAADGEYYFLSGTLYFRMNATNQEIPVTGFHVASGKTFTFPDTVNGMNLANDIFLEGTVQSASSAGNAEGVDLTVSGAFIGATTGAITAKGAPATSTPGGNGGPIEITAALILNQATIDASGANGGAGGNAGPIELIASEGLNSGGIYNTGSLRASGGTGTVGYGGSAATIELEGNSRFINNSGSITADGGNGGGASGTGGAAAVVQLIAERGGGIRNSGAIHVAGGAASTTCAGTCGGGNGGSVFLDSEGGPLTAAGAITNDGGSSVRAAGGSASSISIFSSPGTSALGASLPTGTISISGNFSCVGGSGSTGGSGGSVNVQLNPSNVVAGEEIAFLGYSEIDTYGGDGATGGGTGGQVSLINGATSGSVTSTGGVINYATIVAHGGKATTSGSGGGANGVSFISNTSLSASPDKGQVIYSGGDIDVSGGAGIGGAGTGGAITFQAPERMDTLGALNAFGGAASGTSGAGGGAGQIRLTCGGGISIGGTISANGGAASGTNGAGNTGNQVTVEGDSITNSKAISANGGNSNGVNGGNGGVVMLASQSTSTVSTGALSATGGTGSTNGNKGAVTVDGIPQ